MIQVAWRSPLGCICFTKSNLLLSPSLDILKRKTFFLDQGFDLFHDIFTIVLGNMMIMGSKVNCCSNQISLPMHDIIHASCTCISTKQHDIADFAKGWISCKTILTQAMNSVTNPSNFIGVSIQHQIIIEVVSTFRMTQATCHVESKVSSFLILVVLTLHQE